MRTTLFSAALLTLSLAASASAESARDQRVALLRKLWDAKLTAAAGKPTEQPHYPTEPALPFLSAYSLTRDPKYADQAKVQLDYAHSREKSGLIVTPDGTSTRDYQARQIYNFYLAYRLLADPRYLQWADAGARAMLAIIPRKPHPVAGQTFTLFSAGYVNPDTPLRDGSLGYFVDVNQNAETGYAFSLLYHDPASAFFRDPVAREIAYQETLASMSVQDPSGAIPIGEGDWIDKFDTAYGSYAAFCWVATQTLWRDEQFEPHIRSAGKWLAPKTDLTRDSVRWWPTHQEGVPVPDWEIYYRLPLLWYCHVPPDPVIPALFARMGATTRPSKDFADAPWWYAHYDLMGIPREYYLGE